MPRDPLLTESELAALLRVPRKTLQQWRRKGTGPSFKKLPSGAVRYCPRVVDEFLRSCARTATDARPRDPRICALGKRQLEAREER